MFRDFYFDLKRNVMAYELITWLLIERFGNGQIAWESCSKTVKSLWNATFQKFDFSSEYPSPESSLLVKDSIRSLVF